eukprot:CAMPEP_0182837916 /NCGR_PEP_ID=MMETSP0006_2-20121128/23007_1 /TAXON_ID=97485 /ORGANISM="Prymnesium parvum, Strain Texoma1" /LENGTH=89 /DNA_ID=CAMNT_0024966869 /DNA_START=251 /DNA_END=517 /DNA_ORIENTATION=-
MHCAQRLLLVDLVVRAKVVEVVVPRLKLHPNHCLDAAEIFQRQRSHRCPLRILSPVERVRRLLRLPCSVAISCRGDSAPSRCAASAAAA